MKQLLTLVAALALCHVALAQGQETDEESTNYEAARDMFDFFNSCEGMTYYVKTWGKGSKDSALSESDIANAVDSRLRAARIFRENTQGAKSYFNVYVTWAGNAASLDVGFEKPGFADPYSTHRSFQFPRGMETWRKSWFVHQGGLSSGDVLAQLSKYLDEFIVNYLRVNSDEACEEYRVAEQEHRAKLEAKRDARATRWNDWYAEQCGSLEESDDPVLCFIDASFQFQEIERADDLKSSK